MAAGNELEIETKREVLKIEVIGLPERNYKSTQGEAFYRVIERKRREDLF